MKSLFDNVEKKGRRTDIDILKGIGILTVIYYHFGTAGMLSDYFSSFHMLLFFGVSGYCYKVNSLLCSPKCYIIKKIKAFIRPYLLWVSIYTFINFAMDFRSHSLLGVDNYLLNIVESYMKFGAVWFLMAIFITTLISATVIDYIKSNSLKVVIGLIPMFIAIVGIKLNLPTVFRWEQAFICVPVFIMCYIFHDSIVDRKIRNLNYSRLVGVVFVCGGIGGICAIMNGSVVLSRLDLGKSIMLFYFSAFLSIFAWYSISVIISKQKLHCFSNVFSFLGRNSLYILITHQIIIRIVSIICARLLSGVLSVLIGFFIVTILEILLCYFCETKILKWMF